MRIVPVALFLLLGPATASPAEVAVIAHRSVSEDTLTRGRLLDFFKGDVEKWAGGERVVVKDLKAKGDVRDAFYSVLGMRPSRMRSIWLRKMLSGEGEPPESLASEDEVLTKVRTTPGAIGFISRDKVTDDVKMLLLIPDAQLPSP